MPGRMATLSVCFLALTPSGSGAQDCPAQGVIESVGVGTPGTQGVPLLDTVGLPLQARRSGSR